MFRREELAGWQRIAVDLMHWGGRLHDATCLVACMRPSRWTAS